MSYVRRRKLVSGLIRELFILGMVITAVVVSSLILAGLSYSVEPDSTKAVSEPDYQRVTAAESYDNTNYPNNVHTQQIADVH